MGGDSGGGNIDFSRLAEDMKRRNEELKEKSKPLHELVARGKFLVKEVIGQTSVVSQHNGVYGPGGHSSLTGYTYGLILQVEPIEESSLVKKIKFSGFSPIRVEETILARIPRYLALDSRGFPFEGRRFSLRDKPSFYHDRPFKEEEEAIEIAIFNSRGEIVRVDRSTRFGRYQKE